MKKILTLLFIFSIASTIFASIDYNMVYDSDGMGYDSLNCKYKVKLQIKSNNGDVPIGFFNLRILYNNACLAYNNAESYSLGPIEDHEVYSIDVYTLVPVEMSSDKCGINGVYNGSNSNPLMCYNLNNTWTDCAVLVFDVADSGQNTDLRWDSNGVQNQITLYDASPVGNGIFNGDHDVVITPGIPSVPADANLIYFSEVSDNLSDQLPETAFIELCNVTQDNLNLAGVSVVNRNSGYTVNLSGIVPANGIVIISNGANQAAFETAWNVTLDMSTTVFVQGETSISIGYGYSYSLRVPDTRVEIDRTPSVLGNEQIIHLTPEIWGTKSTPDDADPGIMTQSFILPVEFGSFSLTESNDNNINISWSIEPENNLLGFRLYRSITNSIADAVPLSNGQIIAAINTSNTSYYGYLDSNVVTGVKYYYWVEVVQSDNNSGGFLGPQNITVIDYSADSIDYNMVYDTDGMGYDSVNGKYRVKLQIKTNSGVAPIGYFNLRILYNNACLAYNNAESYSLGPIEDYIAFSLFDIYTLEPVETSSIKCGISGLYTGPNTNPGMCYYLDNTWTDCAVMVFDVVDLTQGTNIRWDISGVQNQVTLYDASPLPNGTFTGDHDIVFNVGTLAAYGLLFFSEISDNLSGQLETTAFIELKNVTHNELNLTGVTVANVITGYTETLSGIIPPYGSVVISNGADQTTFETAWNTTLDMSRNVFIQGSSNLEIGNGYAYSLNIPDVREEIDITPVVNTNERIIQTQPNTWTPPTTPDNADPGDDSPGHTLPVEFSSFTLSKTNNDFVSITWSTKSETDLIGFRLLRSENDELSSAIPLNNAQLIAATNTSGTTDYSHVDDDVDLETTYYYWIEVVQADNNSGGFYGPQTITIEKAAVDFCDATVLKGNYPNPFNPETTISFTLKGYSDEQVDVSLEIYNLKGQKVKTLLNGKINPTGQHDVKWNGKDSNGNPLSSGVYFYKLITPDYTKTAKMVLMK